jgi:hypothetical protein
MIEQPNASLESIAVESINQPSLQGASMNTIVLNKVLLNLDQLVAVNMQDHANFRLHFPGDLGKFVVSKATQPDDFAKLEAWLEERLK